MYKEKIPPKKVVLQVKVFNDADAHAEENISETDNHTHTPNNPQPTE